MPQHANNRLLDEHRKYEGFVKRIYLHTPDFWAHKGAYHIDSVEDAIRCNARVAIKVYLRLAHMKETNRRFYVMTKFLLPLAQRTTAGCFLKFYRDIGRSRKNSD